MLCLRPCYYTPAFTPLEPGATGAVGGVAPAVSAGAGWSAAMRASAFAVTICCITSSPARLSQDELSWHPCLSSIPDSFPHQFILKANLLPGWDEQGPGHNRHVQVATVIAVQIERREFLLL